MTELELKKLEKATLLKQKEMGVSLSNYEIRYEAIAYENGKQVVGKSKKYWIYDKKNREYTVGMDSKSQAQNQINEWDEDEKK
jgi:hypothetical protein